MASKPSNTGGRVATRGFLVQTLIALLKAVEDEPSFTEITLEPDGADEKFDLVYKAGSDTFAVQVKSTVNVFEKSQVQKWAQELEHVRKNEKCSLVLVGLCEPTVAKAGKAGSVEIEVKNPDEGLFGQAAFELSKFIHDQRLDAGTPNPDQIELITEGVLSRLLRHSTKGTPLTRDAFVDLLSRWIREAPRQKLTIDLSQFDPSRYAPEHLIGREPETKILTDAWNKVIAGEKNRPHILTFVALGGEGKTSLVAHWAAKLAAEDWPGCESVFAWSFYSQGSHEQVAASSDSFLSAALTFFGDPDFANSPRHASEKARRLAQLVGERRTLLMLDGLEPLQYPPGPPMDGRLKDDGISVLLRALAASSRGLCIVTTRYSVHDLRVQRRHNAPEHKLPRLSKASGVTALRSLGVKGAQAELEDLVEEVKGHALTLNLLGTFLRDAYEGDVRRRDLIDFEGAVHEYGGHTFRVMDAYMRSLQQGGKTSIDNEKGKQAVAFLSLLGLFDRPASADCLAVLLKQPAIPGLTDALTPLSEVQRNLVLTRLQAAYLITVFRDAAGVLVYVDSHPYIREYFAHRLRKHHGEAWRAANQRLYEHLYDTAPQSTKFTHVQPWMQKLGLHELLNRTRPTLNDLQPLYQAIMHGCRAGLHKHAVDYTYMTRILRSTQDSGFYSTKRLGAFGSDLSAIVNFFESPWSTLSDRLEEVDQTWLLSIAAFNLRAMGRLHEALVPIRLGLVREVNRGDWNNAALSAHNLSELGLSLGHVEEAIHDAERALTYASTSGDGFRQLAARSIYAHALHQANRRSEAGKLFQEAELTQAQPEMPFLYSLAGFEYCDLLLTTAEQAAWRSVLLLPPACSDLVTTCQTAMMRGQHALGWARQTNLSLYNIALDHLTLARAELYTIAASGPYYPSLPDHKHVNSAVDDFRKAGTQDHLPRGLLTRSWYRALTNNHAGSIADLNEAWEIAERGPMRLHMADIHLYRARLFYKADSYPWADNLWRTNPDGSSVDPDIEGPPRTAADDLADARRLITQCGYWRRKEELEDAERAILGSVRG